MDEPEKQDAYAKVVQSIYDEGTHLINFLTFAEQQLTEFGFAPLTAEDDYQVMSQITSDIQSGSIPHFIPHINSPGSAGAAQ